MIALAEVTANSMPSDMSGMTAPTDAGAAPLASSTSSLFQVLSSN